MITAVKTNSNVLYVYYVDKKKCFQVNNIICVIVIYIIFLIYISYIKL